MMTFHDEIYFRDIHLIRCKTETGYSLIVMRRTTPTEQNMFSEWEHVATHGCDEKTPLERIKKAFWDLYGKTE